MKLTRNQSQNFVLYFSYHERRKKKISEEMNGSKKDNEKEKRNK